MFLLISASLLSMQATPLRQDFDELTNCIAVRILITEKDNAPRGEAMALTKPWIEAAEAITPAGVDFQRKVLDAKPALVGFYTFQNGSDPYPGLRERLEKCEQRWVEGR